MRLLGLLFAVLLIRTLSVRGQGTVCTVDGNSDPNICDSCDPAIGCTACDPKWSALKPTAWRILSSNADHTYNKCDKCGGILGCLACGPSKVILKQPVGPGCYACLPGNYMAPLNVTYKTTSGDAYSTYQACFSCKEHFGSACQLCGASKCALCGDGNTFDATPVEGFPQGQCVSCGKFGPGCRFCNTTQCIRCEIGYIFDATAGQCASCAAKYGEGCLACNATTCLKCSSGSAFKDNACTNCSTLYGADCVDCGLNKCTRCVSGKAWNSTLGQCQACNEISGPNCVDCDSSGCKACAAGFFPYWMPSTGRKECVACSTKYGSPCTECNTLLCTKCSGGLCVNLRGQCATCKSWRH